MWSGKGVGRSQDGTRNTFYNILRDSEKRRQSFFGLTTKKESLLEARVIYMPNRPGNPAGLLELAMNPNKGLVSRPLAG